MPWKLQVGIGVDNEEQNQSPLWSTPLDDIEELQEEAIAAGWDVDYRQHEAGALNGNLTELRFPGLMVVREVYGRGFFFSASLPKDFTPAMFPLSSNGDVRLNGLPYDPGSFFVPGDVSEIVGGGPMGIDLVTLHLEPESFSDLVAMLGDNRFNDILRWAMVRHQGDPRQRRAFEDLLTSLLREDTWLSEANPNRSEALRCQILESFAALLTDAGPGEPPSGNVRRSVWVHYARQARDYLDDHLDRAVSLAELCRVTGTSARTLQYAFRDHYGVAPQVYHRSRRLSAVHQVLKQRWAHETTVTDVAFDHGFWHLGRFSQAYKVRFDESPSETLARRPVPSGPSTPFAYRPTVASSLLQIGSHPDRSRESLPPKARSADLTEISRAVMRRTARAKSAGDRSRSAVANLKPTKTARRT